MLNKKYLNKLALVLFKKYCALHLLLILKSLILFFTSAGRGEMWPRITYAKTIVIYIIVMYIIEKIKCLKIIENYENFLAPLSIERLAHASMGAQVDPVLDHVYY